MPRLEVLEDRSLPSTLTVTNLSDTGVPRDGSLRGEILAANSGDTIDFAGGLRGTITLTHGALPIRDSVTIDGPGADRLSVSGHDSSQVFVISNNATVNIDALTITDGQIVGANGGGILIDAGATLDLDQVVMTNNQAMAGAGGIVGGSGGAIENLGSLTVSEATFTNNEASLNSMLIMNSDVVGSNGGAIDSSGPSLTVNNSTFSNNQAAGTSGEDGSGNGGAIFSLSSTATVTNSTFNGNAATGRDDAGGAIDQAGGLMTISNSTFTSNQVVGANGANDITYGSGGEALGGAIINAAPLTITNSTFTDNLAKGGDGGDASSDGVDYVPGVDGGRSQVGTATGGGVANFFSSLTVTNSTFTDNQAIGGNSAMGPGGDAAGGGIVSAGTTLGAGTMILTNVTFAGNLAKGGSGGSSGIFASIPYTGNGGRGFGGGFYSGIYSTATVSYALFLDNQAVGGAGGSGATGGDGAGGAFANGGGFGDPVVALIGLGPDTSTLSVDHSTLIFNVAQGGAGGADGGTGGSGLGGGAYNDGAATLTLTKSLVTLNDADGGRAQHGGADGEGIGGGVYTLGTFTDPFTLIIFNDASTSGDNIGP